jgi:hypothetical protein
MLTNQRTFVLTIIIAFKCLFWSQILSSTVDPDDNKNSSFLAVVRICATHNALSAKIGNAYINHREKEN